MESNRSRQLNVILGQCRIKNKMSVIDMLMLINLGFPVDSDTCFLFRRWGIDLISSDVFAMVKNGDYPYKMLKLLSYKYEKDAEKGL